MGSSKRTTLDLSTAGVIGLLAAFGTINATISGCGSGSGKGTSDTPTTRLVASWRLVKTSGGMTGGENPVTRQETLTFRQNGTFTRTVSGQTSSGTYTVTHRKTIFSESEQPVISYSSPSSPGLPEVIDQIDSARLVTSEEATDGYSREYVRLAP